MAHKKPGGGGGGGGGGGVKCPVAAKNSFQNAFEPCSVKRGKHIDPSQPAQSVQADLGLNFSLLIHFLYVTVPVYLI